MKESNHSSVSIVIMKLKKKEFKKTHEKNVLKYTQANILVSNISKSALDICFYFL